MMRGATSSLVMLAVANCGTPELRVVLELQDSGFQCRETHPPTDVTPVNLLLERLYRPPSPTASIVIDFVQVHGAPACTVSAMQDWCAETDRDCAPLSDRRGCVDIALPAQPPDVGSVTEAMDLVREQLRNAAWEQEAPQEPIVVRAVLVAHSCDEVAERTERGDMSLPCAALAGCAFSCPLAIGAIEGEVPLQLGVDEAECQGAVEICASAAALEGGGTCLAPDPT